MKTSGELEEEKPCAGCGKPAEPDDGLCRECAAGMKRMACVFEDSRRKRDDKGNTKTPARSYNRVG